MQRDRRRRRTAAFRRDAGAAAARDTAERANSAGAAPGPPGRRGDVFDPSQQPQAPGAPRTLGSLSSNGAAVRQRAADWRPWRPRRGFAARPFDSLRQSAGAAVDRRAGARAKLMCPAPRPWRPRRPAPCAMPHRNAPAAGRLATLPPSASPQDEYDLAYGYILRKDYALAEQAFRDFLKKYPNERLLPDAQYWLGESFYQRQRYRDAAESFLAVSTKHRARRQGARCVAAARPVARRARIRRKPPAPP